MLIINQDSGHPKFREFYRGRQSCRSATDDENGNVNGWHVCHFGYPMIGRILRVSLTTLHHHLAPNLSHAGFYRPSIGDDHTL